jgi:hypothetical protein
MSTNEREFGLLAAEDATALRATFQKPNSWFVAPFSLVRFFWASKRNEQLAKL